MVALFPFNRWGLKCRCALMLVLVCCLVQRVEGINQRKFNHVASERSLNVPSDKKNSPSRHRVGETKNKSAASFELKIYDHDSCKMYEAMLSWRLYMPYIADGFSWIYSDQADLPSKKDLAKSNFRQGRDRLEKSTSWRTELQALASVKSALSKKENAAGLKTLQVGIGASALALASISSELTIIEKDATLCEKLSEISLMSCMMNHDSVAVSCKDGDVEEYVTAIETVYPGVPYDLVIVQGVYPVAVLLNLSKYIDESTQVRVVSHLGRDALDVIRQHYTIISHGLPQPSNDKDFLQERTLMLSAKRSFLEKGAPFEKYTSAKWEFAPLGPTMESLNNLKGKVTDALYYADDSKWFHKKDELEKKMEGCWKTLVAGVANDEEEVKHILKYKGDFSNSELEKKLTSFLLICTDLAQRDESRVIAPILNVRNEILKAFEGKRVNATGEKVSVAKTPEQQEELDEILKSSVQVAVNLSEQEQKSFLKSLASVETGINIEKTMVKILDECVKQNDYERASCVIQSADELYRRLIIFVTGAKDLQGAA